MEALAINVLVKFHAEFPMSTVPDWFPPELLVSAKQEALYRRLAFLTALSKEPTTRESLHKATLRN